MRRAEETRRYLTYTCKACHKQGRRYRIVAHALKEHVPLDRVPYYCTMCNFRCQDKDSLLGHIKRYARHRAEEAKLGIPDYSKVLRKGENPVKVDDLMFVVPTSSHGTPTTSSEDDIFADQDDGMVMSGGLLVPRWLTESEIQGPPAVSRHTLPLVPEYVPTPLPVTALRPASEIPSILGFDALLDDIPPFSSGVTGTDLQSHQSRNHVPICKPMVTSTQTSSSANAVSNHWMTMPRQSVSLTMNTVSPALLSRTSEDLLLLRAPTALSTPLLVADPTPTSFAMTYPTVTTPRGLDSLAPTKSSISTPLMDERITDDVMPTVRDQSDPLLLEEESLTRGKRAATPTDEAPAVKKPCVSGSTQTEVSDIIAEAISKGTAKICQALDQQLKAMQRTERAMAKHLEESVRIERRVTSIFRLLESQLGSFQGVNPTGDARRQIPTRQEVRHPHVTKSSPRKSKPSPKKTMKSVVCRK